jgi:hypothetical protein
MNTSYYFSPKIKPEQNLIRISGSYPKNITWLENTGIYYPLCPPWDLVKNFRDGKINQEQYIEVYHNILYSLNAIQVYGELKDNAILLCWEKPGKFCHRRLVSEWFKQQLYIDVTEL